MNMLNKGVGERVRERERENLSKRSHAKWFLVGEDDIPNQKREKKNRIGIKIKTGAQT